MSFITRAAISHLEADDYLVFEPGSDQVRQIGQHLATLGRVTFADSDPGPLADYLRQRHGHVVYRTEALAEQAVLAVLVNRGGVVHGPGGVQYRVFRSTSVPEPHVGECWLPMRAQGSGRGKAVLSPRWVRSVGAAEMSYALERDGLPLDVIKRKSWDRWVLRTRARCV